MESKKRAVTWLIGAATWCVACFASTSPSTWTVKTITMLLLKLANVGVAARMVMMPQMVKVF